MKTNNASSWSINQKRLQRDEDIDFQIINNDEEIINVSRLNGSAASLMIIMVMELFLVRNAGKVGAGPEIVLLSATAALAEDIRPPRRA